jgi:RsiW-degrading membrane proteinase PrsW (M82 family)
MQPANWLGIFLAALVGFVLGGLWFADFAFGKLWKSFLHTTPEQRKKNQKKAFSTTFLVYLIMGWVLIQYLQALHLHGSANGALQGLILGVGFAASNGLVESVFKVEPFQQFLIEYGCQVVTMVVMGGILGLWV